MKKNNIIKIFNLLFIYTSLATLSLSILKFIINKLPIDLNNLKFFLQEIIPFGKSVFLISFIVLLISLAFFIDYKIQFQNKNLFYLKIISIFNSSKNLKIYFTSISIVSIILILLSSLITWPSADDFSVYRLARDYNIFSYVFHIYFNADGRFFSFLIQSILLHLFNLKLSYLIVFIGSLNFIILIFLLSKLIKKLEGNNNKILLSFFFVNIPIMFITLFPVLKENVYWATGSVYIATSVLTVIWIYLVYVFLFGNYKIKNKYFSILMIIFSFFVGGISQNLSLSLIFIVISFLIISRNICEYKINKIVILISILFLTAGSILMYLAPGNFIRGEDLFNKFNFTIFNIFKNYFLVISNYSNVLLRVVINGIASAALISFLTYDYSKNNFNGLKNYFKSNKINFLIYLTFLISAFIGIVPFVLIPDAAAPRSGIYFFILSFIFCFGFSLKIFNLFLQIIFKKFKPKLTITIITLIIFTFFSYLLIYYSATEFVYCIPIRKQMIERNNYLSNLSIDEKNIDIVVNPIILPVYGKDPKIIHFFEIKNDEEFRVNVWVSEYYKIKSVRINK